MRRLEFLILPLVAIAVAALVWFSWASIHSSSAFHPATQASNLQPENWQPVRMLLPISGLSPERVNLGRQLFADKRLSRDFSIACSSCHDLKHGGVDGRALSLGVAGAVGEINAPTVFNSGFNFVQFWDGRASTLEEQAAGPIHNPAEMATDWATVVARLRADVEIRDAFQRAYPDGLNAANLANAIATFERSLVTPNSRFDRFLGGDGRALSQLERDGFQRFQDLGCSSCHQGILLGGNMFQRFGVLNDYFANRTPKKSDFGRFNVTGREEDRYVFKVPGLRNVALTAPYFHDASADTLEHAVVIMGRFQLGRELSKLDVDAIVAFLNTLTGELSQ